MCVWSQVFQVIPPPAHSRRFTLSSSLCWDITSLCLSLSHTHTHTHTHNLSVVLSFVNSFDKPLHVCTFQLNLVPFVPLNTWSFPLSPVLGTHECLKRNKHEQRHKQQKRVPKSFTLKPFHYVTTKTPKQMETRIVYRWLSCLILITV